MHRVPDHGTYGPGSPSLTTRGSGVPGALQPPPGASSRPAARRRLPARSELQALRQEVADSQTQWAPKWDHHAHDRQDYVPTFTDPRPNHPIQRTRQRPKPNSFVQSLRSHPWCRWSIFSLSALKLLPRIWGLPSSTRFRDVVWVGLLGISIELGSALILLPPVLL